MFFAFLETSKLEAFKEMEVYDTSKVSIIIPAHNEEDCIVGTLQSLMKIDYPNLEILLVDDGSTDHTYDKSLPFAVSLTIKLSKSFASPEEVRRLL